MIQKQKIIKIQLVPALFMAVVFFIALLIPVLASVDTDSDGIPDETEKNVYHTDPENSDTDGDGFSDYDEIYNGYSALHGNRLKMGIVDSDSDGAPDSWEVKLGLNLKNPDTDGDGFVDGDEINAGYDPLGTSLEKIKKLITVDLKTQTLKYYFNDVELESFLISSGVWSMPTPTGDFTVIEKVPVKHYGGAGYDFYYPNTLWNLHFTTRTLRYYIHGAYWHNNFGKRMSHGCVNVSYLHMSRLYEFAEEGTPIEIR